MPLSNINFELSLWRPLGSIYKIRSNMSDLVSPCAKCILIIINVVFMFASLGIIIAGVMVMEGVNGLEESYESNMSNGIMSPTHSDGLIIGLPFFIVGGFIFIISFFGCCGATQESRCLLITYSISVILAMIGEIIAVVAALPGLAAMTHFNNKIKDEVRPSYDKDIYTGLGVLGAIQCLGISMAIFMASQLKTRKPVPYTQLVAST